MISRLWAKWVLWNRGYCLVCGQYVNTWTGCDCLGSRHKQGYFEKIKDLQREAGFAERQD